MAIQLSGQSLTPRNMEAAGIQMKHYKANELNRQGVAVCPNHYQHVSAWPGYGRKLCPSCGKVYVHKEGI